MATPVSSTFNNNSAAINLSTLTNSNAGPSSNMPGGQMVQYLDTLKSRLLEISSLVTEHGTMVNYLVLAMHNPLEYYNMKQCQQSANQCYEVKFWEALEWLTQLVDQAIEEKLSEYRASQKRASYSAAEPTDLILSRAQALFEEVWSLLNEYRHRLTLYLDQLEKLPPDSPIKCGRDLEPIRVELHSLLSKVFHKSFVVIRQPPQVLKKETRFSTSVRFLISSKVETFITHPTFQAILINEKQAQMVEQRGIGVLRPEDAAATIANSHTNLEAGSETGSALFRNMQVKKIRRADRKGQELVVEEKFCLVFQANLQLEGQWLVVWTLSLPLVVTVHGNQDCQAHATVLWDNAFSLPNRVLFHVPEFVQWKDLEEILRMWFHQRTGRPLLPSHLTYLCKRLLGVELLTLEDKCQMISRAAFHKDLVGKKAPFTFWEWLYHTQRVTRYELKKFWCEGLIAGFMDKLEATRLLAESPAGSFLLRFSESELGGISIVYNCVNPDNPNTVAVYHLAPLLDKDLKIRGLADRIKDLECLVNLYPNIPKQQAFGLHWSKEAEVETVESEDNEKYVKHYLCMTTSQRYLPPTTICEDIKTNISNNNSNTYTDPTYHGVHNSHSNVFCHSFASF